MKSVIAIGSGSILPLLMSISTSARAGPAASASAVTAIVKKAISLRIGSLIAFVPLSACPCACLFASPAQRNISLGSKFTTTSRQASYFSAGRL
jgi:hypothetical protein